MKFTLEQEVNGSLPFLDVLISRKDDGSFSHQVFQKKTHIAQFLHAKSHYFPAQKLGVLNTLATCALRIYDDRLSEEKNHLLNVLVYNGYNRRQDLKAFLKPSKGPKVKKDPNDRISGVHLPFIQGTTNGIASILKKHNVTSTFRTLNTIRSSLKFVKDPVEPKDMKAVYVIPCSCGTSYIGEIDRSINLRIKEHIADIKHERTRSSALAEHVEKTKHHICIEEANVIAKISHFHHRKFREGIEIERRSSNLNRDDRWKISSYWILALSS